MRAWLSHFYTCQESLPQVCLLSLNFFGIIFIRRWLFRSLIHAYGQSFVFLIFRISLELWTLHMENLILEFQHKTVPYSQFYVPGRQNHRHQNEKGQRDNPTSVQICHITQTSCANAGFIDHRPFTHALPWTWCNGDGQAEKYSH